MLIYVYPCVYFQDNIISIDEIVPNQISSSRVRYYFIYVGFFKTSCYYHLQNVPLSDARMLIPIYLFCFVKLQTMYKEMSLNKVSYL